MTTVEKLLVQIFERKVSIIEQVKQQTELYSQHLASKSLINGLAPPSWLWNPNITDSEELNKEELISKLLRPYPQPSAPWSFVHHPGYSNLVITGDNEEFSDRVSVEIPSCSRSLNRQDDPTVPALHTDDAVCVLNCPEPDASFYSPDGQTDESILNIYNAPDQSLAGIKRSKSRQKALEIRSNAKATAESGLIHENISNVVSSKIRFPLFATDQDGQNGEPPQLAEPCAVGGLSCKEINLDEAVRASRELGEKALERLRSAKALAKSSLKRESISDVVSCQIRSSLSATNQVGLSDEPPLLAEPCAVGTQSCEEMNLDEADCTGREIGMDTYPDIRTRSRSCTEVPVSVEGSFTLGSSLEDCGEKAFCHVAKARRTESMPFSHSELADNYIMLPKSAGPSTICCQSCGDRSVDDADFLRKDKETNIYAGKFTRSKISRKHQNCGSDSSEAGSSSDNSQGVDTRMMDSGNGLQTECVDESLLKINLHNVPNKGCGVRESILEDLNRHKERSSFPSCGSIQHNACVDKDSDLEVYSLSVKADEGILASSSLVSALQINDSYDVSGLAKSSAGLFRRLTRSQAEPNYKEAYHSVAYNENPSYSGKISTSDCKQKSVEELQNSSSGQSAPACYETHNMLRDDKTGSRVMVSELLLHNQVDQSCSSSYFSKQRSELESQVAPTLGDSFAIVEPKQLDCKETEEYNLKAFTSESGKGRLDKSLEEMSCYLSVPEIDVSLGRDTCGGANQLSLGKQSPEMLVVLSEGHKSHRDSFECDVQKNPGTHAENLGPVTSDAILKVPEDSTENFKISEAHHDMQSKVADIPDIQIHPVNLHIELTCESSPVRDLAEGGWNSEEKDRRQLLSSAPESKNSGLLHYHSSANEPRAESYDCLINKVEMTNPIALYEIEQFAAHQSHISSCLEGDVHTQHRDSSLGDIVLGTHSTVRLQGENSFPERRFTKECMESWPQIKRRKSEYQQGENSLPERRFTKECMESWPQIKRRKIEHRQGRSFITSPTCLVKTPHSIQRGPASMCLKPMEINGDTTSVEPVNKSTDVGISQEMNSNLMEGIEPSSFSKHGEVGSCYKENNEHKGSWSGIDNEQLRATISSRSTLKDSRNSQGHCIEEVRTSLSNSHLSDTIMSADEQCCEHSCNLEKDANNLSSDELKTSSAMFEGIKSPMLEGGRYSQQSVLPLNNEDLQPTDVDQSMPVFEGFIVNAQTDSGELNFAADGFDEGLKLSLERASIIAEICRSASLDSPSCQLSSAFKFQGTQNLFQSLPNVCHLEHLDLGDTFPANSDVGNYLQSGCSSSDSVSLAYSGACYSWSSRNQHEFPVGNLWDWLSSHTGSSEKRLSSNPELTCFPIEEDPSVSEENKTMDENAGDVQEDIDSSLANQSDKRQPLKDLRNVSLNMSVSAEEETLNTDGVDFVSTKFNVSEVQEKVGRDPKYRYRNKSETSNKQTSFTGGADVRNQPSSIGAIAIKKGKESINNSISRPIVSNKTSLKGHNQKLSLKESTRNNIVSNVSSFIPLMQQKQATTACAGKRDVKVKALEAAENAKRLEEKKEIERKLRKEALIHERAKLEEKNLRRMELEKKKKEDERKKKDADIVAKKRLREDDERKGKEKKRMRLEVRQKQREQEEQKRVEKPAKENQRAKDEQMNSKKKFQNEPKQKQNRETIKGDGVALQKAETKLALSGVVMNEECGTSGLSCEAEEAMDTMDKSPRNKDLIAQNSQGKSYDISPYQCSDDEDEEDDGLPTKKFIPSWASKSSVALFLPLQQEIDPDMVFPPASFCSMEEVLLPRKLQKSQVPA